MGGELLDRMRRTEDGTPKNARLVARLRDPGGEHVVELGLADEGIAPCRARGAERQAMLEFWEQLSARVIVSYGATRNLTPFRDSRHAYLSEEVRRQITLFEPLAQIPTSEVLLAQTASDSPIWTLLRDLIKRVFGDQLGVVSQNGRIRFTVEDEPVEAMDLPDGFRSSIAWLTDLCAVWCEKFPRRARRGDPSDIDALVLIDEIDLHLHASMQRALVPRLREALPRVQWIVTTHSPLTVASFDSSEIVVLDRTAEGGVRALDRQILGFTADQVCQWLMETPASSAALEGIAEREGNSPLSDEQIAEILEMSPEVGASEAQERVRGLMSRLARLKP